ncbi:aldose epimerase family protein [Oecophyllibacter saccharovorans]|uniref:aldose epimerase family protein n=1 Tax=Oecophyllibacter saccharovorans TaxID=2558360 RepID=UPI00116A2970|nr:aldose epimerase family protein [Oecophyllibacter saccharovorans]TPW35045.1 galactose mutarotase [Oecophyllibacter saccharovorans]
MSSISNTLPARRLLSPLLFRKGRHVAGLLCASALSLAAVGGSAMAAPEPTATVTDWGKMPDGQTVQMITLHNDHGVTARILTYGATIQSVDTPDRAGKEQDIALGFPNLQDYLKYNDDAFFGAVLGRVANRIAGGSFQLEGKTYHLPTNQAPNTLHGGPVSFKDKLWTIAGVGHDANGAWVTLRLVSPDGDQGFPGELTTLATYKLNNDDDLSLNFKATTNAPTIVNLATHNYWNLNGEGSGSDEPEILQIFANRYIPTNDLSIPTGKLAPVEGTPFDFRQPHRVGERLRSPDPQMSVPRGYDKCWVIDGPYGNGHKVRLAAKLIDPRSGRVMEVLTNLPGMQFYTTNNILGNYVGPSGRTYRQTDALAFEPEFFPDSPNQPAFPSIELKPGQTYDFTTVFHFSTEK